MTKNDVILQDDVSRLGLGRLHVRGFGVDVNAYLFEIIMRGGRVISQMKYKKKEDPWEYLWIFWRKEDDGS